MGRYLRAVLILMVLVACGKQEQSAPGLVAPYGNWGKPNEPVAPMVVSFKIEKYFVTAIGLCTYTNGQTLTVETKIDAEITETMIKLLQAKVATTSGNVENCVIRVSKAAIPLQVLDNNTIRLTFADDGSPSGVQTYTRL